MLIQARCLAAIGVLVTSTSSPRVVKIETSGCLTFHPRSHRNLSTSCRATFKGCSTSAGALVVSWFAPQYLVSSFLVCMLDDLNNLVVA